MNSTGIVDRPGPTVFFKIADRDSRNFYSIVEKDILRLLEYINHEKKLYDKLSIAALISARTMHIARAEQLKTLQRRKREIQQELYHAAKTVTVSRNHFSLLSHQHFRRDVTARIVSSAWDGTEYKYQLLQSLHSKLQKKTILEAIQLYCHTSKTIRQITGHLPRMKNRRLLQLCFSSLMLEGLSSLYITAKAMQQAETYLLRGVAATWFFTLLQSVRRKQRHKHNLQKAKLHFYFAQLKRSLHTFCTVQRAILRYHLVSRWARVCRDVMCKKRVLLAWMSIFAHQQQFKLEMMAKYNPSQSHSLSSDFNIEALKKWKSSRIECEQLLATQFRQCLHQLSSLLHNPPVVQSSHRESIKKDNRRANFTAAVAAAVWLGGYDRHNTMAVVSSPSSFTRHHTAANNNYSMSKRVKASVQIRKAFPSDPLSSALGIVNDHHDHHDDNSNSDDNDGQSSDVSDDSLNISNNILTPRLQKKPSAAAAVAAVQQQQQMRSTIKTVFDRALDLTPIISPIPPKVLRISSSDNSSSDDDYHVPRRDSTKLREIKIKKLLSLASRFLHHLHLNTHATKAKQLLTHKQRVKTLRKSFYTWSVLKKKLVQQMMLSESIYMHKLQTRVFVVWQHCHQQSRTRLESLQTYISHVRQYKLQTKIFRSWKQKYHSLLHQEYCCLQLQLFKRNVHFKAWKKYHDKLTFHKIATRVIRNRLLLRPCFTIWREKKSNKKLLRKVFMIRETAWFVNHKFMTNQKNSSSASCSSFRVDFHLLDSLFTAWKEYTQSILQNRQAIHLQEKALFFRGSVLFTRYFYGWRTFVTYEKLLLRYSKLRAKRLKSCMFQTFQLYVKNGVFTAQQQVIQALDRLRQQRGFQQWRKLYFKVALQKPQSFRVHTLQQNYFQAWKVMKALRLFHHPNRLLSLQQRQKRTMFMTWYHFFCRHQQYKLGLFRLQKIYWFLSMKRSFMSWPGRREIWAVNQLRERIARKGTSRIMLVDTFKDYCQTGDEGKADAAEAQDTTVQQKQQKDVIPSGKQVSQEATTKHVHFFDSTRYQQALQAIASEEQKSPSPAAAKPPPPPQHETRLLQYKNIEKSFIRAHGQRNFSELAYALGFLTNFPDPQGLTKIHNLVTTLFSLWIEFVTNQKKLRLLAAEVRIRRRMKMLKSVIRKWIASTPRVSYRIITWLEERDPDNLRFDRRVIVKRPHQYIF